MITQDELQSMQELAATDAGMLDLLEKAKVYHTLKSNYKPAPPQKPEFPKNRLVCDLCGDITETGKHTSWLCRMFGHK